MPSYEDFVTKADSFRAKLLRDRAYKRLDIAKQVYDGVRTKFKYIIEQIQNLVSYVSCYNIHRYGIEAYLASRANEIGEKAVKVNYNDSTETVDSYEIPSYARFSYDEADYENKLKQLTPELAKQYFKFAIPIDESPPTGDVEDVKYAYFFPDTVDHEAYHSQAIPALDMPVALDYGLFGVNIKAYKLYFVEGEAVMPERTIDGADVYALIMLNPMAEIEDPDTGSRYKQALKFFVYLANYTSYTVILTIYGHKLSAGSGKGVFYVLTQDLRIFPAPYKIYEGSVA